MPKTPEPKTPVAVPVIIVGNGLAGLITALTLAHEGYEISLIGKDNPKKSAPSIRTITVNPRSVDWLKHLGLWQWLIDNNRPLTPIMTLAVGDDTHLDTHAIEWHADPSEADPSGADPLGFVVREDDMAAAAWAGVAAHRLITAHHNISIIALDSAPPEHCHTATAMTDSTGKKWLARLIIACDGASSPLRAMANIKTFSRQPKQTAIVADIDLEHPHDGMAWQRFMVGGPIALMPLTNPLMASMVWTLPSATAQTLLQYDRDQFNHALHDKAHVPFGRVALASERLSWHLQLHDTPKPWGERIVLLGDAAHAIHPLAGQGFNLTCGDAIALGETLAWAAQHGGDIGGEATLKRYARRRRLEVIAMTVATDGLNHLFSFAPKPLRHTARHAMQLFGLSPLKKLAQEFASGRNPLPSLHPLSPWAVRRSL